MNEAPQVLIVGAGPVGLTLAAELTRFGIPIRIVDKAPHPSETSKALVLWSRSLELLDRMGLGDRFVAAGRKAIGATIFAGQDRVATIRFDHVASRHPYGLMLPQSETERLLADELARGGIAVERGVELTRLAASEHSVTLALKHPDGRDEQVTVSWVVGCDGAHSAVRHALGLPFAGSTLLSRWILADLHISGSTVDDQVLLYWHAEGLLALFPITPGRYRVVADVADPDPSAPAPSPTLADIQALVARRGPSGLVLSDPVWLSGFRINERKVTDYRAGRVFIAGDAAHVHSPAGGQGMNTGMQDAANLAWKLALVTRGEAQPEPLLGSYSTERSAIGDMVLRNAGRLTAIAVVKNAALQAIRNHVAAAVFHLAWIRDNVAETMTEVALHYADGPLVTRGSGQGGPASGEPAPLREGESPFGAGPRPRFTLCADEGEAAAGLRQRYPTLIEGAMRAPFAPGGLWLVRPDGYVALAATEGDVDAIGLYLDRLAA